MWRWCSQKRFACSSRRRNDSQTKPSTRSWAFSATTLAAASPIFALLHSSAVVGETTPSERSSRPVESSTTISPRNGSTRRLGRGAGPPRFASAQESFVHCSEMSSSRCAPGCSRWASLPSGRLGRLLNWDAQVFKMHLDIFRMTINILKGSFIF